MAKTYKFSDGYTVDEGSFYSSYETRQKVAQRLGINYTGTSAQTTSMANKLFGGGSSSSATAKSGSSSASSGATSAYQQSSNVTNAQAEADAYRNKLKDMSNVTNIVDQSTWDAINTKFTVPDAYTEAMNYTNSYLEKLSSGKTSYTDRINALMNDIQNRDKFEYDADNDTLFQQALASAMSSGKTAMQDTIGQASALTGGYGSTYATSAGNQAYNSFIEDAYNNLPEYYQMAMEAYQMEGEEMYKQLAMLSDADATEYQRTYDAWSANFANAQNIYNNAYNLWSDNVSNAFQSAGLQLSEYGQIYDQTYKTYSALAENAQQMYQNEYNQWVDSINNAYKYAELSQRQNEFDQEMAYKNLVLSQNSKTGTSGSGTSTAELKEPTETQMARALEAFNTGGMSSLNQYINSLPDSVDKDRIAEYAGEYGTYDTAENPLPLSQRTFTVIDDGGINWFNGVDNNAKVQDQYGNVYKLSDIKKEDEALALNLSKLEKGKTYSAK